jgi:acetolactate synthase-1/3 small subunit
MSKRKNKNHILSIIAKDNPRLITRITNIIAKHCINIEMMNTTRFPSTCLIFINITLKTNDEKIETLRKQFEKIVETIEVQVFEPEKCLKKEAKNVKNIL